VSEYVESTVENNGKPKPNKKRVLGAKVMSFTTNLCQELMFNYAETVLCLLENEDAKDAIVE
jgi:hypothetical protein